MDRLLIDVSRCLLGMSRVLQISTTGLNSGQAASIEVPIQTVRDQVAPTLIAGLPASKVEAVIMAVTLGVIGLSLCHVWSERRAGASSATSPWWCSGLRPPSHAPVSPC